MLTDYKLEINIVKKLGDMADVVLHYNYKRRILKNVLNKKQIYKFHYSETNTVIKKKSSFR